MLILTHFCSNLFFIREHFLSFKFLSLNLKICVSFSVPPQNWDFTFPVEATTTKNQSNI